MILGPDIHAYSALSIFSGPYNFSDTHKHTNTNINNHKISLVLYIFFVCFKMC